MRIIEALDETSSKATENAKAYVNTTKKYYKLKAFQQLAIFVTSSLKLFIYGILFTLGFIFSAVGLASFLNTYFNNNGMGYFIVALVFFFFVLVIYLFRKQLDKIVIRKLSENYFDS